MLRFGFRLALVWALTSTFRGGTAFCGGPGINLDFGSGFDGFGSGLDTEFT